MTKVQGKGKGMGSDYGPCPECGGTGWVTDEADEGASPAARRYRRKRE
jgi:hypothetical protein